tara:strand:+ start:321 stop:785 length:465 start_codon:yes stop_codon:yes gene_type:complete
MKLSNNFHLRELTKSEAGDRLGLKNQPTEEQLVALTVVVNQVLQPVREKFGIVTVNSGIRSEEVNRAVGGSKKSQHCKGEAVDFECYSTSNWELAKWIQSELDFDQLILEFYKKGDPHSGWVHCSYSRFGNNRRQQLTALKIGRGVKYEQGLLR